MWFHRGKTDNITNVYDHVISVGDRHESEFNAPLLNTCNERENANAVINSTTCN